jgi:predicted MPP superfamily phosphohydrolase
MGLKIALMSDLHLEFFRDPVTARTQRLPVTEADANRLAELADVVVLAGDIHSGPAGVEWAAGMWPATPTIYVLGNHESYYFREWSETLAACRRAAIGTTVRVLENEEALIGGVRFLGATLWTDMAANGTPALSEEIVWHKLNDYRQIKHQGRRLQPGDTRAWHKTSREWLAGRLADGPAVVVTHHGPHMDTQPPQFRHGELAPGFSSDLSDLFCPNSPLWICGHTHYCCDFAVGGTRIVSNQPGYPGEAVAGFDPLKIVEV